ncbi:hypothetical protein AAFN86_25195 [Roseomonas sp. CAU 1739]|uniref:hypothetical protein n=1 Tax=Roseomonas sp. CAU 1739 TaxID=3140364 RepID=UPI00325B0196
MCWLCQTRGLLHAQPLPPTGMGTHPADLADTDDEEERAAIIEAPPASSGMPRLASGMATGSGASALPRPR